MLKHFAKGVKNKFGRLKKRYKIALVFLLIFLIWFTFCLPQPLFDVPYSTVVSDSKGNLIGARIADDQQWRFPQIDSLPEKYKIALMEFEDKNYKYHPGVNPLSVGRAIVQNVKARKIVSGGSTLTMQTIRLARKENRTYFEKFLEAFMAVRLEIKYSKDDILKLYASHAPMGGNVVGIEAASWRYFGHQYSHLTWAEAATLAVLPNTPSILHFGKNRDKLLNKRNKLLKRLNEKGYISDMDYSLSIEEPLPPAPLPLPQIAPHLVARIHKDHNGKRVVTTLDTRIQGQAEQILSKWNAEFAQNRINNIAAIIFDVEKNEVIAYCGNVNFFKQGEGNQVDILQAPRSTGSILKPFLYCAMLQEGSLLPDELLPDVPININGFAPKNFSKLYDGAVPASSALARSLNIPSVVSLKTYTVPKFYNLLKRGGFSNLSRSAENYGLSLILGGAEASMWDVSRTYLHMAQTLNNFHANNNNPLLNPNYVLEVKGDNEINNEKQFDKIYEPGAIYQTMEALTNANRPEELDWRSVPSMQKIAWKTGTSYGFRDALSVGVTPKYVVGVWVGNADGEGRPGLIGARTAGMVMFDLFNILPQSKWFDEPENDLYPMEICKQSGMIRSVNCPENEVEVRNITYMGRDAETCKYHKILHVSDDGKYQTYADCSADRGLNTVSWFVLPPVWEWYYKNRNTTYRSIPPLAPECTSENTTALMEFIYPFRYLQINIPKHLDGSNAEVIFEIAHRKPEHVVYWHLDDVYIGQTKTIHKKSYVPDIGKHKLTVVDESGEQKSVVFYVK